MDERISRLMKTSNVETHQKCRPGLFRFNIRALESPLSDARLDEIVGLRQVEAWREAKTQFWEEDFPEILF